MIVTDTNQLIEERERLRQETAQIGDWLNWNEESYGTTVVFAQKREALREKLARIKEINQILNNHGS